MAGRNGEVMAEEIVLKLDHVSKSFARVDGDDITHALGDIDTVMRDGEFVSIVGTSGCGKSTILRERRLRGRTRAAAWYFRNRRCSRG